MEQKRSKGITVIGYLGIALSLCMIGGILMLINGYFNVAESLIGLIRFSLLLIFSIGLLKLKNWARIGFIALELVEFFNDVLFKLFNLSNEAETLQILFRALSKDTSTNYVLLFLGMETIIIVVIIFYLTRPKVKEQFK